MTDLEKKEIDIGLKLLAKSSLIVFIGIFLSKLFTYLYRIIIARYYGPEVYGLFSLAIIVLGFFVAFSSLGFAEGILRFTSLYRGKKQIEKIRHILRISLIILFFSGVISGFLLFFFSEFISINLFHNHELTIFLKIFSVLVPFSVFSGIFLNILRAYEYISLYSFIWNILQNLVKLIALVIFVFFGLIVNAIIFSHFLGVLIILLASYFFCRHKLPEIFKPSKLTKEEKNKITKEMFSYSWPVIFSGLIVSLFYWIDSFFIGYFMNVSDVGVYNSAIPLAGLMSFIPVLFTQLFLPLITKEFSRNKYRVIFELSKQVAKWIFTINLPLFLIMFLFPGALINLFFGSQYLGAETSLRILSIGGFISSLLFLSNDLISMKGKSGVILTNLMVASTLNVILNIFLIPRYGLNGAAISTTIVLILMSLALLFEVKLYIKFIPLKKDMIKIFLVSLIPLLSMIFIKQFIIINLFNLILIGSFFILTYFFLIFLTGCLDKNDFMILNKIKNKIFNV